MDCAQIQAISTRAVNPATPGAPGGEREPRRHRVQCGVCLPHVATNWHGSGQIVVEFLATQPRTQGDSRDCQEAEGGEPYRSPTVFLKKLLANAAILRHNLSRFGDRDIFLQIERAEGHILITSAL